jgi:hypothetical protein
MTPFWPTLAFSISLANLVVGAAGVKGTRYRQRTLWAILAGVGLVGLIVFGRQITL